MDEGELKELNIDINLITKIQNDIHQQFDDKSKYYTSYINIINNNNNNNISFNNINY